VKMLWPLLTVAAPIALAATLAWSIIRNRAAGSGGGSEKGARDLYDRESRVERRRNQGCGG